MDHLYSLVTPTIVVVGLSWLLFRDSSKSPESHEEISAFNIENISINIFQGFMSKTIEVKNTKTPQEIAEIVHKEQNLTGKQVIVSCRGRKLVNDMSIGLQGIRDGDFFHIVLSEGNLNEIKKSKSKKKTFVLIAAGLLVGLWTWFLTSEEIPNVYFRCFLVLVTEIEVYVIGFTKL